METGMALGIATDNAKLYGMHAFEVGNMARLGAKAPFRFMGVDLDTRGTCDHCGALLANICLIKDATGKRFGVGVGCAKKTGDKGLYRAFLKSPEVRAANKAKRDRKGLEVCGELRITIESQAETLRGRPHPYGMKDKTALDYADFILVCAGDTGRARLLKQLSNAA